MVSQADPDIELVGAFDVAGLEGWGDGVGERDAAPEVVVQEGFCVDGICRLSCRDNQHLQGDI